MDEFWVLWGILANFFRVYWYTTTPPPPWSTLNEAANDSGRVSGQDREKPPALGTNQIAEFGGFRPLAGLKKKLERFL